MVKHNHADSNNQEIIIEQGNLVSILDSMEDGVCIINEQYELEYGNVAFQSEFGPVKGRKCYQYFYDRQERCPWCDNKNVIVSGKTSRKEFYSTKTHKTYDLIASPLKLPDGRTVKTGTLRDITERQKAKDELEKYRGHLEELVRQRTAELSISNEKLKQEIAERKCIESKVEKLYNRERTLRRQMEAQISQRIEFTRALVHELKTPLTALLASSDLLVPGIKEESYLTLVNNIQLGILNLNKRISELFDLAKGEIGMLHLQREPSDLMELLRETANYISPATTLKQQSVIIDLPDSLPIISMDRDRLQEVLFNLLDNACKFAPTGGRITLKARQVDGNIVVEIEDTGNAISKQKKKRLFKPYYHQEDDQEQFSGLGLGLALCKTLIELHRGQIWVKSQHDSGNTFGFSLPV